MEPEATLMLSSKQEEDAADELLLALTSLAKVIPVEKPKKKKKKVDTSAATPEMKKHRSRFFFKPTQSFAASVQDQKDALAPAEPLENENAEVDARVKSYLNELPISIQPNIEEVREFFIDAIAPKTLAVQAATAQALDVIQRTLNAAIDPKPFAQFERMVDQARLYKMAEFVATYMGLPKSSVAELVNSVEPKKEMMIFHPDPYDQRRPKPAKQKQADDGED